MKSAKFSALCHVAFSFCLRTNYLLTALNFNRIVERKNPAIDITGIFFTAFVLNPSKRPDVVRCNIISYFFLPIFLRFLDEIEPFN